MENLVKAANKINESLIFRKFKGEDICPKKIIGVYVSNPTKKEINYIDCEMNKSKMENLGHFFYIFGTIKEDILNTLSKSYICGEKHCWILPKINQKNSKTLEEKLFYKVDNLVALKKHHKKLLPLNKRLFIADEESFVLNYGELIKLTG